MKAGTVFISYRREDSAGYAGRLFDRLADKLGRDRVFRDIDGIAPGENFAHAIRERIDASDVLLVLIGPRWLSAVDPRGKTRLQSPDDLVRLEIQMGLERKLQLIPVLLPGAAMPSADQLPASIAALTEHNAVEIRERSFDHDVALLISAARPIAEPKLTRFLQRPMFLAAVLVLLIAALGSWVGWQKPTFLMSAERARMQIALMRLEYNPGSFVESASRGDMGAVSLYLRAGMDPNERAGDNSAFDMAIRERHFDVAKLLIQSGVDKGLALVEVADGGSPELFNLLLSKKPSRDQLVGALYSAARGGQIDFVRRLLDLGVSANDRWYGSTPLAHAAYYSRLDVVKLLLARGADVNAVDRNRGGRGETALHYATREAERLEVVRALLEADAAVNVQDRDGTTPLMNALQYRDVAVLLLAAGAKVDLQTKSKETVLIYAAGRHLPEMVKLLVRSGADVNARTDRGETALMWTSGAIDSVGDTETSQTLLDNGAKVDLADRNGWTALMWAANKGIIGSARVLLSAGANKNLRNKNGQTALQLATASKSLQIIAMLKSSRSRFHS